MNATASDLLQQAQQQAAAAQAAEEAARQRLAEARRERTFWERLLTHLQAGCPASAWLLLRQEGSADNLAMALRAWAEQEARRNAATFQRDFPEALSAAGLALDGTARHPRYTLLDGFLHVGVDDDALTATVAPRDGEKVVLGLDLAPLVETVRRDVARLLARRLDPDLFLRRLRAAYEGVLQEEARSAGDAVALRRVVARLSKEQRPFAADEFNVDLARLIRTGQATIDGQRLCLQQTRHAKQGMLLHGLEQGGYTGFISFQREEEAC